MSLCLTTLLVAIAEAQLERGLPPPAALSLSPLSVSGLLYKMLLGTSSLPPIKVMRKVSTWHLLI